MTRIISYKLQHCAWITWLDSSHPPFIFSSSHVPLLCHPIDADIIRGNISPASRTTNFELSLLYWKVIIYIHI